MLLYINVPRYYVWENRQKLWVKRKGGNPVENWPQIREFSTLGCMYSVHLRNYKCFCLRLRLYNITGPANFEYLKTVNGVAFETFQETCFNLGLLEYGNIWDSTIEKASLCRSATQLRQLFSIILSNCNVSNPI